MPGTLLGCAGAGVGMGGEEAAHGTYSGGGHSLQEVTGHEQGCGQGSYQAHILKAKDSVIEQNSYHLPSIKWSREVTPWRRCYSRSVAAEPSFHYPQKK